MRVYCCIRTLYCISFAKEATEGVILAPSTLKLRFKTKMSAYGKVELKTLLLVYTQLCQRATCGCPSLVMPKISM